MKTHPWIMLTAFLFATLPATVLLADSKGQEDLDAATVAKLEAKTLSDLAKVIDLCESALEKGLDKDNEQLARELMAQTLLQRASQFTKPIFGQTPPDPRWVQLRILALRDLNKAAAAKPELGETHLLIAKLQLLPGGERDEARKAVDKAIEAYADDDKERANALTLRGRLQEDDDKQLADFNEALKLDPTNEDALRMRGIWYVEKDRYDEGLADLLKVLQAHPDDIIAHQAAAEAFTSQKKFDEALAHLNKSIDLRAGSGAGYILRARLYALKKDNDKAIADLNAALDIDPTSLAALLMRAELRGGQEKYDQALADVERILELRPGLPQAILLRSGIYAAQEKFTQAIADLERLLQLNEDNEEIRLQIAAFYIADKRPSRAIEVYTEVLADHKESWRALRGRGDALLSIGKQAEAIKDYEQGIKLKPDEPGLVNNLAWVLATSPKDEIRDGKRSVELATKAAELSEYKAAYILSTLAAANAESGDFETAKKWSEKALEIGADNIKEDLQKELDSYKEKKPWRELQQVEEKPEAEKAEEGDLDL